MRKTIPRNAIHNGSYLATSTALGESGDDMVVTRRRDGDGRGTKHSTMNGFGS